MEKLMIRGSFSSRNKCEFYNREVTKIEFVFSHFLRLKERSSEQMQVCIFPLFNINSSVGK